MSQITLQTQASIREDTARPSNESDDLEGLQRQEETKDKKHFKEGFYESKKNNKKMHYRSGLECEYYKLLELMNDVSSYHEEAFAINYMFEGHEHRYIPEITYIPTQKIWFYFFFHLLIHPINLLLVRVVVLIPHLHYH